MHLVLTTFGTQLSTEHGTFVVEHPTEGKQRLAPTALRSITAGRGVRLTSDALLLAIRHEVDVLLTEGTGQPVGRIWSHRYGSISTIRRRQVAWAGGAAGAQWVLAGVAHKIGNQAATLLLVSGVHLPEGEQQAALLRLDTAQAKVQALAATGPGSIREVAATVRGLEGAASATYFAALSAALPPAFRFERRSRQPAQDAFNALLNYAYGVLYGLVEGALIRAGLDPYLGVLHRDEYNRPTLVYDMLEEYRVWAEYVVVQLCLQQAPTPDCFEPRPDGGLWLAGFGKRLLLQSLHDYLDDEVVERHGLRRSRASHLQQDAHRLAQQVLALPDNDAPAPTAAPPPF